MNKVVEIVAQYPQIESQIPKDFVTPVALEKSIKDKKTKQNQQKNQEKTQSKDKSKDESEDKTDSNPGTGGQTST